MSYGLTDQVVQFVVQTISLQFTDLTSYTADVLRGWIFVFLSTFVTTIFIMLHAFLMSKSETCEPSWKRAWIANASLVKLIVIAAATLTGGLFASFIKVHVQHGDTVQWTSVAFVSCVFVLLYMMFNGYSHSQFYDKKIRV